MINILHKNETQIMNLNVSNNNKNLYTENSLKALCLRIIKEQVEKIIHLETVVIGAEENEALHDLRVGIRRTRVGLLTFKPLINPIIYKYLKKTLKESGDITGNVRDLDVFIERVKDFENDLKGENGNQSTEFSKYFIKKRNEEKIKLVEYLNKDDHHNFIHQLIDLVNDKNEWINIDCVSSYEGISILEYASVVVKKRLQQVMNFDSSINQPFEGQLHKLRIEAKKLRYAIEFFANNLNERGEQLITKMKAMQDILGEINDIEVALKKTELYINTHGKKTKFVNEFHDRLKLEKENLLPILESQWEIFRSGEFERILIQEI